MNLSEFVCQNCTAITSFVSASPILEAWKSCTGISISSRPDLSASIVNAIKRAGFGAYVTSEGVRTNAVLKSQASGFKFSSKIRKSFQK